MVSAAIDTAYLEIHFPLQKKKKKMCICPAHLPNLSPLC